MKKLWIALALVVAVAAVAVADKPISTTLATLEMSDLEEVRITILGNGSSATVNVVYEIKEREPGGQKGNPWKKNMATARISNADEATLLTFIEEKVLAKVNEQEGL